MKKEKSPRAAVKKNNAASTKKTSKKIKPPKTGKKPSAIRKKNILLMGATGLVGRQILEELIQSPFAGKITVLTRRDPGVKNPKVKIEIVDFENLEKFKNKIKGDVLISAFGTTIKSAGYDKATFRKWDIGYPLDVAGIAHKNGCQHFLFVSAIGTSESSMAYYSRVKAEMENLSSQIGFSRLDIFQPSLLLGDRDEHRPAEKIFSALAAKIRLPGSLKKYNPVQASDLARAIVKAAEQDEPGKFVHTWEDFTKR